MTSTNGISGGLKSKQEIIAEHGGEKIDEKLLDSIPPIAWNCCLKGEEAEGCYSAGPQYHKVQKSK